MTGLGRRPVVLLLVAVMVFVAEALRTSGPLLDHVAGAGGVPLAAVTALTVYAVPVLIAPLARWLGTGRAMVAAVAALVVLRLIGQVEGAPGFAVAMATAIVAVGALVLVVDQVARSGAAGGLWVAVGVALGGAVDVAVRAAFGTWDPVWRPGLLPWLYTGLACVVLIVLLWRAYPVLSAVGVAPRRLPVLGLYLALYTLVLGSPAFVASQAGVGLPWAVAVLLVGALLAVEAVSRLALPGGSGRLPDVEGRFAGGIAAVLLAVSVAVALFGGGILVVLAVLVGQVAVAVLLARAFTRLVEPVAEPEPVTRRPSPGPGPAPRRPGGGRETTSRRPGGGPDDAETAPVPVRAGAGRRPAPGPKGARRVVAARRSSTRPLTRSVTRARDALRHRAATNGPDTRATTGAPTVALAGYVVAGLGAGLGFVVVVLGYQMTYELPLPFDNRFLPIAAALVLGVAGMGVRPGPTAPAAATGPATATGPAAATVPPHATVPADAAGQAKTTGQTKTTGQAKATVPADAAGGVDRAARRGRFAPLALVPAVLLLVPVLVVATAPAPAKAAARDDSLRLVTWNLHYGVNDDAAADPATIVDVLTAQHPDVVLLQEVNRGWPIGAGTDLAEYLSRALAMPYVWSPAADGQFGNVILSSLPMTDVRTGRLPFGAGPQRRSYAMAKVELPSGRRLTVCTAHLQDHTDSHPTRIAEIDTILRQWRHATPAVIGGDFNSMPGWPELDRFTAAGLVSAQDSTGHAGMLTSPTDVPKYRPDWIFGTTDVSFSAFQLPITHASDHYPLAVTVHLG